MHSDFADASGPTEPTNQQHKAMGNGGGGAYNGSNGSAQIPLNETDERIGPHHQTSNGSTKSHKGERNNFGYGRRTFGSGAGF